MPGSSPSSSRPERPTAGAGAAALEAIRLGERSHGVRRVAILGRDGSVIAATGGDAGTASAWDHVPALLAAAAEAISEPVTQVHVATEAGEVFVLRGDELVICAIADRFALASLMFADMRMALRALAGRAGQTAAQPAASRAA